MSTNTIIEEKELPQIKRAREFKLYTYDGRILLDLYRGDGRAFSGFKPGKTVFTLKNMSEQGVFCAYPSVHGRRLQKALRSLFPVFEYTAAFVCESDAVRVLQTPIADPARGESGSDLLWRPGLPVPDETQRLLVRIPAGGFSRVSVVCSRTPLSAGDILSPVEAAVLSRAVYDWQATASCGLPPLPEFPAADFIRRGCYLQYAGDNYRDRFFKALAVGVLLPPNAFIPVALPLKATKGEWGKIKNALE